MNISRLKELSGIYEKKSFDEEFVDVDKEDFFRALNRTIKIQQINIKRGIEGTLVEILTTDGRQFHVILNEQDSSGIYEYRPDEK